MPMTDHTSNVLAALVQEFPLAARLESLDPDVQRTYGAIVSEWYRPAMTPDPARFERSHLAALEQSDAIIVTPAGVGCYPFSATPTGIRVTYLDQSCQAMCAIDALAIPCLVGQSAKIDAVCTVCQRPLTITVDPRQGSQGRGRNDIAVTHSGVVVLYTPSPTEHEICCRQLCPSIVFVCEDCVDPRAPKPLSIAAATVVAAGFFSFQRKYLSRPTLVSEHT